MALNATPVRTGTENGTGSGTSFTPSFATAASSGNLLIAAVSVTQASRTFTASAGWTAGPYLSGTLFSYATFWKISDGTETGLTITAAGGTCSGNSNIYEFDGSSLVGTLDASSSGTEAAGSGADTGVATGSATSGLAIAIFGADVSRASLSTTPSYTDSMTRVGITSSGTSRGGFHIATKLISASSNDCQFTSGYDSSYPTEGQAGCMLVFGEAISSLSIDGVSGTISYSGTFTANLTAGGSSGSASITQGSYSDTLTINSWGSTSASLSLPAITSSHLVPGSATLSMTNAASQNDTLSVTVSAPTGYSSVTLTSVASTGLIPTSTALGIGDVVIYTSALGADFVVNADGTYSVDGAVANGTYTATLRVWDATDGNWGSSETLTIIISEGEYPLVVGNMSLSLTLNDVALRYSGSDKTLPVSTMELSLSTSDVGLVKGSKLSVGNMGLTLSLQDVGLSYAPITKAIVVETMSLALSLKSVGLVYSNATTSSNYVFVKPLTKNIARSLHGHF